MSAVGEAIDKEDRPNYVQFETRAVENKLETLKQGHYVGTDVDFVMVTTPGGRDVYESKAGPWFEKKEQQARNGRLDPDHLTYYKRAYKKWKEGLEIPLEGTPVRGWGAVSPAQEKTILMAGIRTIEDLAESNDEALRRLGMGGRDLVNKAKSWLNSASDHGKVAMENAALKKENENLKTTVESLEEKVNFLMHKMEVNQEDVPRETIKAEDIIPGRVEAIAYSKPTSDFDPNNTEIIDPELPLSVQYYAKFGKKPHHLMKEETIRKKLEE